MDNGPNTSESSRLVLQDPNLLRLILRFQRPRDLASSARVSTTWFSISLTWLWKDVTDLEPLFSILAPMTSDLDTGDSERLSFIGTIQPEQWERFELYATHVHTLAYYTPTMHQAAFEEIARTRIRMNVLPNLRSLKWSDPQTLQFALLFMHHGVESFKFKTDGGGLIAKTVDLFNEIAFRMSNSLRHFAISCAFDLATFRPHLITFLRRLPSLRQLTLPPQYMTPTFFAELSEFEQLEGLDWVLRVAHWSMSSIPSILYGPGVLSESAFPSLRSASFQFTFSDGITLLSIPFSPPNLTHLCIASGVVETSMDEIRQLLTAVATNCKRLLSISLSSFNATSHALPWLNGKPLSASIDTKALWPLTGIHTLTSIQIRHHVEMYLSNGNIESLISHWPDLTDLVLTPDPTRWDQDGGRLTLEVLPLFSQHCPKLTRLELCMDATAPCPLLDNRDPACNLSQLKPLSLLEVLNVGTSPIESNVDTAMFLSRILPPGCVVEWDVPWFELIDNRTMVEALKRRRQIWESVGQLFQFAMRVRLDERLKFT